MNAPQRKPVGIVGGVSSLANAIKKTAGAQYPSAPLDRIDADPNQPRTEFNEETLAELAADIKARELIEPLVLRPSDVPGRFILIAGERRLRACRIAGLEAAPYILRDGLDAEAVEDMQFAENIQREDLSLTDMAREIRKRYERHKARGVTNIVDTIAAEVHKSKGWVSKYLAATDQKMPSMVAALITDGVTEDLELVHTVRQIHEVTGNYNDSAKVVAAVRSGDLDRAGARAILTEAKMAKKTRAEQNQIKLEQKVKENAAREAKAKEAPALRPVIRLLSELSRLVFEHDDTRGPLRECVGVYLNELKAPERQSIDACLSAFHARGPEFSRAGHRALLRVVVDMLRDDSPSIDAAALNFGGWIDEPFTLAAFWLGAAGEAYSLEAIIDAIAPADLATLEG